jgi:hypothetical protein
MRRIFSLAATLCVAVGLAALVIINGCAGPRGVGFSKPIAIGGTSAKSGTQNIAQLDMNLDLST